MLVTFGFKRRISSDLFICYWVGLALVKCYNCFRVWLLFALPLIIEWWMGLGRCFGVRFN